MNYKKRMSHVEDIVILLREKKLSPAQCLVVCLETSKIITESYMNMCMKENSLRLLKKTMDLLEIFSTDIKEYYNHCLNELAEKKDEEK